MKESDKVWCVLYDPKKRECSALKVTRCGVCRFRKTVEEEKRGLLAASSRLRSLPFHLQDFIAAKYYEGKTPWHDLTGTGGKKK